MPQPRRIVPEGGTRSVKNASGSDIPANTVVKRGATEDLIVLPAATTDRVYGVTMSIIKNGEWGDLQIEGRATCRAHGALATPGTALMPTTAGRVDTWAAAGGTNAALVGVQNTTAAAQDELIEVDLATPFALQQG